MHAARRATPEVPLRATTIALAALVAARALAALVPWRGLWGWDVQRFLDPALAWSTWAMMAAALTPAGGRALGGVVAGFGRALGRPWGVALAMAVAAALVWSFPDRLHYVGDFLMRIGAVRQEESPDVLSPQAFPLDVLVHYALPLHAQKAWGMAPDVAVRVIGALGAALLAAAAAWLAPALAETPAARGAAFAIVCFGGALCLFTGESKAFGEMVVLLVAFAACATRAVRAAMEERTGAAAVHLLGAGACVAIGLLFHRYALGFFPAWLLAVQRVLRLEPARRSFLAARCSSHFRRLS